MMLRRLVIICCLLSISFFVSADNAMLNRKDVRQFINNLVVHDKFARKDVIAAIKQAQFQTQVIESMEKPYEKKNWDVYRSLFVTQTRVQEGIEFWQANAKDLERAQKEFGVPADMIVAILGIETKYGKRQGEFRVLDALTTLAFFYPKRSEYFTKELREYFLLCRERHVPVTQYIGSYAGAIGQPQFMPSSYRMFAVDFAGRGQLDLVNNTKDSIGSVANYFNKHGWARNEFVVQPLRLVNKNRKHKHFAVNSKYADYDYKDLLALGFEPISRPGNHPEKVGIIELVTAEGIEYWLAYPNFYVITRYNSSPQYALAAYLLAQQLREKWAQIKTVNKHAFA